MLSYDTLEICKKELMRALRHTERLIAEDIGKEPAPTQSLHDRSIHRKRLNDAMDEVTEAMFEAGRVEGKFEDRSRT